MDGNQVVINIVKAITFGASQPYAVMGVIFIFMLIISVLILLIGTMFDNNAKIKSNLILGGVLGMVLTMVLVIPVGNAQNIQHAKAEAQFMRLEKPRYYHVTHLVNQSETKLTYVTHQLSLTADSKKAKQLSAQKVNLKNQIQQLKYQQTQIAKRIWNRENRENQNPSMNHDIWYHRAHIKDSPLF